MHLHTAVASSRDAILFAYDSSLHDLETLLQGISRKARLLPIAPDQDAIEAISAALAEAPAAGLVLLSHGSPGRVHLGRTALSAEQVKERQAALASWGVQRIALYACHAGLDASLAEALSACTGARVLSSQGAVGHQSLGADWSIDAPANGISLFSRAAKAAWVGSLALGDPLLIADGTIAINTLVDYDGSNAVTVTAPITVDQANALDLLTTGVITATISDGAMALLNGLTGSGNAYSITITDLSVDAVELNTLNGKTSVALDATAVTTLTGAATAALSALNAVGTTVTGLNNPAVTLNDSSLAAVTLNQLNAATTGVVNATLVTTLTGNAADLLGSFAANTAGTISGLGSQAITLADTTLGAASLNQLDAVTTGVVNATLVTTLTGNAADLLGSFAANTAGTISGLGSQAITLADTTLAAASLNQLDAATTGVVDAASVTTLSGNAADLLVSFTANNTPNGISGLGNEIVTLADTTLATASLTQLDAATTGTVNAASVTTIVGTFSNLNTFFSALPAGFSGIDGSENLSVTGPISVGEANTLNLLTTGVITATLSDGAMSALNTLSDNTGALDNAYTITISDTTVQAAALNALDDKTSVAINAAAVTGISGAAVDVIANYTANALGSITGLGNEAITLSDTSLSGAALNLVNAGTTGVVNASSVTTLTGNAADLLVSFAAGRDGSITGLGTAAVGATPAVPASQAVTLSDTTLAASSLNQLNADTNGVVNASSVTTLSGNAAALLASFAANNTPDGISGLGSQGLILDGPTLAVPSLAAADLNALDAATTGVVNAASITTLTGNVADLLISFNAGLAGTISGLGSAAIGLTPAVVASQAVTVNDADLTATSLNQLDGLTNGVINAAAVSTLRGLANDVLTSYGAGVAGRVTGLGNEAVVLTDTSLAATALNQVDAATNGLVDATTVLTLSGAANEVLASYAAGIAGLGTEAVTLNNTNLAATVLNQVNAATTGVVNAASVTTLTGNAADLIVSFAANNTPEGISGLGNEALTLSDTALTAAVLNQLDAATSGVVNAASITNLSGTAAELLTSYAAGAGLTPAISGLGNEAVTLIGDLSLDAAILNQLDAATTGPVDASGVQTITGAAAEVARAYSSAGITGLGNEGVTLSDGVITAALLNQVEASTTGVVNAGTLNTITGAASEVLASYATGAARISGLGNEAINITDATIAATSLNQLNAATGGLLTAVVDASSVTTINGLAQDVLTAYNAGAGAISGLGNEAVVLSNSILGAAALNAVDAATTGVVDAALVATLTGSTTDLLASYAAGTGLTPGISGLGNEAVTVEGSELAAAALNQVDAATTGVVNAGNASSISGTITDIFSAYIANAAGTISGLGNENVNLDGVISIANANIVDALTTGAVAGTILERTVADLKTLTGTDNAYRISISDNAASAADLNLINSKSTVAIDALAMAEVTGLSTDIEALLIAAEQGEITFTADVAFTATDAPPAGSPLSNLPGIFGEFGMLDPLSNLGSGALSAGDWATVTFSQSYINPVVIISDPTYNGAQPVVVRMQGLTGTGFQYALQEYNYLDGAHMPETLSYMVMEAGTYQLADGSSFTAGTVNTNLLSTAGFADLGVAAANTSTLLTQVQTTNGMDAVVTRTRVDAVTGNYAVAMQEQESLNSSTHKQETVGYVAFTAAGPNSTASDGDLLIEGGLSQGIDSSGGTVTFSQNFTNAPTLLTKVSTFNGADPVNSRIASVTATGFSAFLQEEKSFDAETLHKPEQIGFLAFDGLSGTLTGTEIIPTATTGGQLLG